MTANQAASCNFPRITEHASTSARDAGRFEELVREHGPLLMKIALRQCGNRSDAYDLVQDTFERGLRGFSRFQQESNGRGWLTTILGNLFIDNHRAKARQGRASCAFVPLDPELMAPVPEEQDPTWAAISIEQVREALDQLGENFRVVYELHALEGHSYQQIAEHLGIPRATVGTRLNRARRQLKTLLAPPCEAAA